MSDLEVMDAETVRMICYACPKNGITFPGNKVCPRYSAILIQNTLEGLILEGINGRDDDSYIVDKKLGIPLTKRRALDNFDVAIAHADQATSECAATRSEHIVQLMMTGVDKDFIPTELVSKETLYDKIVMGY